MKQMTKYFWMAALGVTIFMCATAARAQGSRKDDVVFNAQGRPMAGATVHVCTAAATGLPCSPSANIYSDAGLTQALANPMTADGLGNYTFYAAPGRYEIEISGPGITTKQLPNVILPSDPSAPTFTTVTTTSGISAFSLSLSGNLTVSGSASVAGTLSIGGAPIPSATADNQWTASQRFKGPDPWRDVTAYMKDSNGNAVNCSSAANDATYNTTGTINLSTPTTLTLASARDFKTGCGLAVLGAGAAPTIVTPPSTLALSTVSGTGTTVTVNTSSNHNLVVGSGSGIDQGVQVSGCSISAMNGTFPIQTIADATHLTYTASSSATGTGTGCVVKVFFGYAHGLAGSTTYNYKIVAVDANMGVTAASSTYTVTTGNATLNKYNYNHLMWALAPSSVYMWGIYSDKGTGGALTCVGMAFTNGFSDMGFNFPCPDFMPANPPASSVSDALNTTITAGGGTTTLTLAAAASTAVTSSNVYHDESSFVAACVNDVNTDQYINGESGSYGCYIPSGRYWMNGQMPTATQQPTVGTIKIRVAGTLVFHTMPWFFRYGLYDVEGDGAGAQASSFAYTSHVPIFSSATLPAVVVMQNPSGGSDTFSGFALGDGAGVAGTGIWATGSVLEFDRDSINTAGGAAGIQIENSIGVKILGPTTIQGSNGTVNSGLPSILFSNSQYDGQSVCCVDIDNLFTSQHGIGFIGPGGNGGGAVHNDFTISHWLQENQAPSDNAMIQVDNGPNAPGETNSAGFPVDGINLNVVYNSDISAPYNNLFAITGAGASSVQSATLASVNLNQVAVCAGSSTVCASSNMIDIPGLVSLNSAYYTTYLGYGSSGFMQSPQYGLPKANATNISIGPTIFTQTQNGASYAIPSWAMMLPAPNSLQVTGTGSGSLAADTYCMAIAGVDNTGAANETNLSATVCQAVGASGSIGLSWREGAGDSLAYAYSGDTLYYCVVTSGTCVPDHKITGVGTGHSPVTYTFNSTAGGVLASANLSSVAMLSWLSWDSTLTPYSCFFCVGSRSDNWPIGMGIEPTPSVGINLFSKLGIRAGTQYQATEGAAPGGVSGVDLLYADSTAHQWKKIENNGAVFSVAGTLAAVTGSIGGSALTAGQCAGGTVSVANSTTSMTVSVSPNTYPGDGFIPWGYVSANGTVTVKVCAQASGTPASSTYNVRVIQ